MLNLFFLTLNLFILINSLQISHPLILALSLLLVCVFFSSMLIKLTYSWVFYLLILMFLGGIMIVVIYMASLAANEKMSYKNNVPLTSILILFLFLQFNFSEISTLKVSSSFVFAGDAYGFYFSPMMIFCFGLLLLAMISAINLTKLEEGPLVKRL